MISGLPINAGAPVNWQEPLNRGLVSWWMNLPYRQWGGGTLWRDLCRKSDGTLTNMAVPSTATSGWNGPNGRRGGFGVLAFDGSNDFVSAAHPMSFASAFTVSAWAFLNAYNGSTDTTILSVTSGANDELYLSVASSSIPSNAGKMNFNAYNGSIVGAYQQGATNSFPLTTWTHFAGVWDGTNWIIYKNGISFASVAGGAPPTLANNLGIGAITGGGRYWNGYIDSVRMQSRALNANEMLQLYTDELNGYRRTLNFAGTWTGRSVPSTGASVIPQIAMHQRRQRAG